MPTANEILDRTVTFYRAFEAHPALHPFMQPGLRASLETLAKEIIALLPPPRPAGTQPLPETPHETVFTATRSALGRLQHCIRGWYAPHEEVLRTLAPLTLGDDPTQDIIRLGHLATELPAITEPFPVFVFPPDLAPPKLKTLMAAHKVSAKALIAEGLSDRETSKEIIGLRPRAYKLWQEEGLDAWIKANVFTNEGQVAFGRERRHRTRKAAGDSQKDQPMEGKSGQEKSAASGLGEEKGAPGSGGAAGAEAAGGSGEPKPGGTPKSGG